MSQLRNLVCLLALTALVACGGGEERQVKYLERAQSFYDEGNYEKAKIEAKNVLQINPRNADARYLMALIDEQDKNWRGLYSNLSIAVEEDPALIPARLKLGQFMLLNQGYDGAREHADVVLAAEPDNADGWVLSASILLRQGNTEEAVVQAEKALALKPGSIGAIAVLANVYQATDPEKAMAIVDQGLQDNPSTGLKLLKVRMLEANGEEEQVIALFQELLADEPETRAFRAHLVKIYQRDGRTAEAEALVAEYLALKPDDVEAKLWQVQIIAQNKGPEAAQDALLAFIDAAPEDNELRFALAKLQLAMKLPDAAQQTYKDIIALDDESADSIKARNGLIQIAIKQNEREQIEALVVEILELEPDNGDALRTRATLYLMDKDVESAIADLRTVLRNDPQSVKTLLLMARAYEVKGSRELALDSYKQVLAIEPNNKFALLEASRLQLAEQQAEAAEDNLRQLLELAPDQAQARFMLVSSLVQQQKWALAEQEAAPLLDSEETRAQGQYLLGRVYFSQGDYPKAIDSLTQALADNPNIVEALEYLMGAYARNGQVDEGRAYLAQHLKAHPKHFHAHRLLGDFQRQQGDAAAALASYQQAMELAPGVAQLYQRVALHYMAEGDNAQAIAVLEKGVSQAGEPVGLMVMLANIYNQSGDYDKARATYEAVLERKPGILMAANNLAILLVDHYSDEASLRQAEEVIEVLRESQEPALLDTMGWVNYRLGNTVRAVTLLETAVQLGGKGTEYSYHLGMAYHQSGQHEKAREQLELALADSADFAGRQEAEAALQSLAGS